MPGGGDFLVFSSKSTVGLQAKLKVAKSIGKEFFSSSIVAVCKLA